jgi:hypothetical protein
LSLDYIINAAVGMILSFDLGEGENRTIGSSTAMLKTTSFSELTGEEGNVHIVVQRISNGVVEGETQG